MKSHLLALALVPACTLSAQAATVAHWTFDSEADFNAGVLVDVTGNGNDMTLNTLSGSGSEDMAAHSTDTYFNSGAVQFNGDKANKGGQYFQTGASAPINDMTFTNGYTVEMMFKVPAGINFNDNRWMAGLTRTGRTGGDAGATLAISNMGEVQWASVDINGNEQAAWSDIISDDTYHHVAVVNYEDGQGQWVTEMYLDGELTTRGTTGQQGLQDFGGAWNIGLGLWDNQASAPFNGLIDDIRVSDVALAPTEFVNVPEPASLSLIALGAAAIVRRRRSN